MPRFEDLEVWKRSARLSADLYRHFEASKNYGFRDQITRAGLSIPSNIAEGHERDTPKNRPFPIPLPLIFGHIALGEGAVD